MSIKWIQEKFLVALRGFIQVGWNCKQNEFLTQLQWQGNMHTTCTQVYRNKVKIQGDRQRTWLVYELHMLEEQQQQKKVKWKKDFKMGQGFKPPKASPQRIHTLWKGLILQSASYNHSKYDSLYQQTPNLTARAAPDWGPLKHFLSVLPPYCSPSIQDLCKTFTKPVTKFWSHRHQAVSILG